MSNKAIAVAVFIITNSLCSGLATADSGKSLAAIASADAQSASASSGDRVILDRNGEAVDPDVIAILDSERIKRADHAMPIRLSLDSQINRILKRELASGLDHYRASLAAGYIMNVNTGEIVAMATTKGDRVGPADALKIKPVNSVCEKLYEIGSTARTITAAMALDSGKFDIHSLVEGSSNLYVDRYTIQNFNPYDDKLHIRTIQDAFLYSSNTSSARLAKAIGSSDHKAFLKKLGQLDPLNVEWLKMAAPSVPQPWTELSTVNASFGQAIRETPLQSGMAMAALVNGGFLVPPTLQNADRTEVRQRSTQVIKSSTSEQIRSLMRLNVERGTGRFADVAGYFVGGRTDTGAVAKDGRRDPKHIIASFTAIVPADKPEFLVMIILDNPQPLQETFGLRLAGWNAAPVAGHVIEKVAPLLGIEWRADNIHEIMASEGARAH